MKMTTNEEIDIDFLISLVKARPVLWDKNTVIYHDRVKSKSAWLEICAELNPARKDERAFCKSF